MLTNSLNPQENSFPKPEKLLNGAEKNLKKAAPILSKPVRTAKKNLPMQKKILMKLISKMNVAGLPLP